MTQFLKKLTITQTIIFLSTFLFSVQALYGLMINNSINTMGHHIVQIEKQYIPLTKKITLLTEHQLKQETLFERAFRYALVIGQEESALEKFNKTKNEFNQLSKTIDGEIELALKELAHDISIADNEESKKQFQTVTNHLTSISNKHKVWDHEIVNIFQLLSNSNIRSALEESVQAESDAIKLEESVIEILAEIEEYTKHAVHKLSEEDHNIFLIGIALLGLSLVLAIILTKLVTSNIKVDLDGLKAAIKRIAEGDLSSTVSSKLGQEFGIDIMQQELKSILATVKSGAEETMGASIELAEVSTIVMKNVHRQAEEIDLVSVAMNEMEATSLEVARHAESTRNSTVLASQKANESRDITKQAMNSMSNLTTSLTNSSQSIEKLDQHSANISSVLNVIKGIADQTNLLALNAAIEAARAGEQGRGFAVVADEVRTLAQRTQNSTIEIEDMINLFTNGTSQAVQSMKVNSKHGEDSHHATLESNQKIEDIQVAMQDINDMNSQIATAAEEQSCTSQELSKNTVSISKLSAENIESFSRVSASSEQLSSLAKQLTDKVGGFKLA